MSKYVFPSLSLFCAGLDIFYVCSACAVRLSPVRALSAAPGCLRLLPPDQSRPTGVVRACGPGKQLSAAFSLFITWKPSFCWPQWLILVCVSSGIPAAAAQGLSRIFCESFTLYSSVYLALLLVTSYELFFFLLASPARFTSFLHISATCWVIARRTKCLQGDHTRRTLSSSVRGLISDICYSGVSVAPRTCIQKDPGSSLAPSTSFFFLLTDFFNANCHGKLLFNVYIIFKLS